MSQVGTHTFILSFLLHPSIPFLNSLDFPFFFEYYLVILDKLDMYTALAGWLDARSLPEERTRLTLTIGFLHNLERERGNEGD